MKAFIDRLLTSSPEPYINLDMVAHLAAVDSDSTPKQARAILRDRYDITIFDDKEYVAKPA